jgi:transcription elongation factor GreA
MRAMQIPKRKSEEHRKYGKREDNFLSTAAIRKLQDDLRRLQDVSRPRAVEELTRTREMGDLSENAAYSEAKGRLMGIDRRILELKDRLKNAVVIERGPDDDGRARLGATVVVRVNGKEKSYEITGAQETDPGSGRISLHSPLGAALVGKKAGDTVTVKAATGKDIEYLLIDVR